MIRLIALFFFIAGPTLIAAWNPGLRVRFDVTGFGNTSFMSIPQSSAEAILQNWVTVERPTSPPGLEILQLWCSRADYAVCVLIDDTGYIAGVQIALDTANYSDAVFDWETQGFTQWSTNVNGETKNYWTAQQYYISASTLAQDPEVRIANRNPTTILQDGNIWVSGFNGKLFNISTTVSDFTDGNSIYTVQSCIPLMGLHYYYNMSQSTTCESDTMFPWFPLVESDYLVGVGFISFGKINIPEGNRDWFELPDRTTVMAIVPRGPECLYTLADSPGLVTMHTYFIRDPVLLGC